MAEGTYTQLNNTEPSNMGARPRVGFGRGLLPISSPTTPSYVGSLGRGRGIATNSDGGGTSLLVGQVTQSPLTSTPIHHQSSETESTLKHLGVLITEVGKHIGDSVTARLLSDSNTTNCQGRDGGCT